MLSRLSYGIVGIIVVALSFSATLFTLNQWSGYPFSDPITTASIPAASAAAPAVVAPAAAAAAPGNTSETPFNALPKIETAGFQWAGIAHLNVQPETGTSVVTGQTIMRIVATPQDGFHTLAGQFSGLNKNQVYRVMAWVKPTGGSNIELEASDQANGQPLNHAVAIFNLANHAVISADGAMKERGIDQGPDGWQKIWLDLMTSAGQIVISLRPINGGAVTYKGDGRLGVVLGGVEADPRG
jgi:hypothetical protein